MKNINILALLLLFSLVFINCKNNVDNSCEKTRESEILTTLNILESLLKANDIQSMDSKIQDIKKDDRFLNYSYIVGNSSSAIFSSGKFCLEKSFGSFDGLIVNQHFFTNSDSFYIRVREGHFKNVLDNSQTLSGFVINTFKRVNDSTVISGNFEFSCAYNSKKYAHFFFENPDSIIIGLNKNYIPNTVDVRSKE
jgi:hypothetical protein